MGLCCRGIERGARGPVGITRKTRPDDSNRINPPHQRAKKRERCCLDVFAARTASQIWTRTSEAPGLFSLPLVDEDLRLARKSGNIPWAGAGVKTIACSSGAAGLRPPPLEWRSPYNGMWIRLSPSLL
ncbi:hypothetical protein NDU88_002857 [Pleurodeles waltl]|uniref:Uncharacterized protein n=1 Tax=Pleurodeles waltl TaxID=8319 RepID=A0AAV7TLU2_PLEWA|nr:hypothetical protein NDU88_002857 [Pleurodeles waltl]